MTHITIKTEGPMSLTSGRSVGFETETLKYIPGATFRGAMAKAYLENDGAADHPAFVTCFVDEQVRFTDLRPSNSFPWPASLTECANHPLSGESFHPLIDLLPLAAQGQTLIIKCAQCGGKVKALKGFAQADRDKPFNHAEVQQVGNDRE